MREDNMEKSSQEKPNLPANFPYKKAWVVTIVTIMMYLFAAISVTPIISQYTVAKLREEVFNSSNLNETVDHCSENTNTTDTQRLAEDVQKKASSLTLYYSLAGTLLATITNAFIGHISDSYGRKITFVLPLLGVTLKDLITGLIIYFKLNLNYFYLAHLVDGLSGSYFTLFVATFSYTADITTQKSRTFAVTVMEGCFVLGAASGLLATGFIIRSFGFFYPLVMLVSVSCSALVIVSCFLPETVNKEKTKISPLKGLKDLFGFYFTTGTMRQRLSYIIALGIFFFGTQQTLGRNLLETLYELAPPFCWSSVKIGYFGSLVLLVRVVCTTIAVKLLQYCLREEVIGIISCLSAAAAFILEGVADTDLMMYLVPVVGAVGGAIIPIARGMMSKMTSPSQQGALFASIALIETICHCTSSSLYNAVYAATVDYNRGIVWFMMAGLACMDILLFLVFLFRPVDDKNAVEIRIVEKM